MPERSQKPCRKPGCVTLTRDASGYCDRCKERAAQMSQQERTQRGRSRASAASRGYDADWQALRDMFLQQHPVCKQCLDSGDVEPATVVHHRVPISVRPELRLDERNLMALCESCHEQIHGRRRGA